MFPGGEESGLEMAQKEPSPDAYCLLARYTRETIHQILKTRGWTQSDAVVKWGIPQGTLSAVMAGMNAAGAATISAILDAERWDPVTFYLQHPRLGRRHLEVGESPLHKQFDTFVRVSGSDERAALTLTLIERLEKLGARDEVQVLMQGLVNLLEHTAAGQVDRKRRRP
jgi:hypothetical protein